ncbi:hypothetical protein BDD12DRAFT_104086 [Trichophaea hybrida]|nr:hypothetical protein BDD12DRAFT_104086 [Trichophaea hybrida]
MCRTLSSNIPSASLHPVFSLSIKGDDKLSLSGTYTLHMTLTYQSSSPSLSPITFREPLLDDFISDDNWVLSHQTPSGSITIPRNDNPPCMVGIDIDEKDVVGESGNYMELAPGSAVEMELVFWRSNYDYEEEMRVGERYRLQYMGGRVAWWDWGAKEVSFWRSGRDDG